MTDLVIGRKGRRKVCAPGARSVTRTKRRAFLDALALTCNVRKSAAFAEIDPTTAYRLRRDDAAFGTQWQAALEMGYDRLETLALEDGGAGGDIAPDPERAAEAGAEPAPFDFDKAMKLLMFHRAARQGQHHAARGGTPLRNATREETTAALMKALAAAERRVAAARRRAE